MIFGGLVGAILWNLVTWLLGLPSSSSHALFGGLIGATWVFAGTGAINFSTVAGKVLLPLALSPVVAGVVALSATWIAYRIAARGDRRTITRGFARAQIVSASMIALAHGTNDAQKTMGVITLTLITVGLLPAHSAPPLWVVVAAGLAIAAGTAMGGWRIINTLGRRISDIQSPQGFAAETASAAVILSAAHLGFALSTTQVASGAVLGSAAGRARRPGALARGGPDGGRLAADPAGGGHGGRARGLGRRPRDRGNRAGRRRAGRRLRRHLRAVPAHARHRSNCHRSHRHRAARAAHHRAARAAA